jgi:hypothetical protein
VYVAALSEGYLCSAIRSVEGFKINLIRSEENVQSYCNKIFAGWDFCITNRSMAELRHSSLRYELRVSAAGSPLVGSSRLALPCLAEELGRVRPACVQPGPFEFTESGHLEPGRAGRGLVTRAGKGGGAHSQQAVGKRCCLVLLTLLFSLLVRMS